jgi:hypothetical protein
MQDLLTATIVAIAILFTASAIADFTAGLVRLWRNAGTKAQPRVEAKPAIEPPAIANQVEPASALPDLWMQPVEEVALALPPQQMNNIKPTFLLPAAPEVAGQPENVVDYSSWSIRALKKEAQRRKLGKYSSLTKSQLIERLAA